MDWLLSKCDRLLSPLLNRLDSLGLEETFPRPVFWTNFVSFSYLIFSIQLQLQYSSGFRLLEQKLTLYCLPIQDIISSRKNYVPIKNNVSRIS